MVLMSHGPRCAGSLPKEGGGGRVTLMYRDAALGPVMIRSCTDVVGGGGSHLNGGTRSFAASCHASMRPAILPLIMGLYLIWCGLTPGLGVFNF